MRGFFNGWVITLIFTAAIGYFAVRHWPAPQGSNSKGNPPQQESAKQETPDTPAAETPPAVAPEKERKPAAEKAQRKLQRVPSEVADHDVKEMKLPASRARGMLKIANAPESFCESVEYRGPDNGRMTDEQWRKTMVQFHNAKHDLLTWLADHRTTVPKEVAEHMESEVKELRLQRPPTPDFPDLAFRGIGLWTRPSGERPIIKLGGGFGKLAENAPGRARFELSRLIAQTWSPCELAHSPVAHHLPAGGAFAEMLSCLSVKDDNACAPGSFSEAGWAVSSAIAAVASPPGCTVPAFAEGVGASCLKEIQPSVRAPASTTKGARR
jgi:hypothetical protein